MRSVFGDASVAVRGAIAVAVGLGRCGHDVNRRLV